MPVTCGQSTACWDLLPLVSLVLESRSAIDLAIYFVSNIQCKVHCDNVVDLSMGLLELHCMTPCSNIIGIISMWQIHPKPLCLPRSEHVINLVTCFWYLDPCNLWFLLRAFMDWLTCTNTNFRVSIDEGQPAGHSIASLAPSIFYLSYSCICLASFQFLIHIFWCLFCPLWRLTTEIYLGKNKHALLDTHYSPFNSTPLFVLSHYCRIWWSSHTKCYWFWQCMTISLDFGKE